MTRQAGGRRERRTTGGVRQIKFGPAENRYPPMSVISADEIESIHFASMRLLSETGMEVMHDESTVQQGLGSAWATAHLG